MPPHSWYGRWMRHPRWVGMTALSPYAADAPAEINRYNLVTVTSRDVLPPKATKAGMSLTSFAAGPRSLVQTPGLLNMEHQRASFIRAPENNSRVMHVARRRSLLRPFLREAAWGAPRYALGTPSSRMF